MYDQSVTLYEQSFKNLQTDHIDYYLIHNISDIEGYERRLICSGVLEFLKEERRKGRIRNIGCSAHAHKDTVDYVLQQDMDWDFVQIQMSYYDWAISSA